VFQPLLEYFQGSPVALIGLLTLLVLCGLGLPIPEDIILLTTGVLVRESGGSWLLASLVMYAGVLAGDSLAFLMGRHLGKRLLASRWALRFIPPCKQQRIQALFRRYGSTVYFVARFLPGLRAAIFCSAGAMKAKYLRFVFFDGLAALVSVPLFVWLGYFLWGRFGNDLAKLNTVMAQTHNITLVVTVTLALVFGLVVWRLRRRVFRAA
jgi:membrane protein DedA with SNARE-associated domain